MTERTHFTPADCLTHTDLEALYARQTALAERFRADLHRLVRLDAPDLQKGACTTAYPALFNTLEGNLRALCQGHCTGDIADTRTWHGVERDKPRLDFGDVNRWFATVEALARGISLTRARMPVTNACTTGGGRTKQWIRTVNS